MMGPIERELRVASDNMLENFQRHGSMFPCLEFAHLPWWVRNHFNNRTILESNLPTLDDWTDAIEAAEAMGL